jgi:hypothetical protein
MQRLITLLLIVLFVLPWLTFVAPAQRPSGNAVMIIVDESTSVTDSDHGALRWELARTIIDTLDDGDVVNMVRFASMARLVFPSWSLVAGQRTALKAALRAPMTLGVNTNVQEALEVARTQFAPVATLHRQRIVFLISDGRFTWSEELTKLLLQYKSTGIVIYTLNVNPAEDPVRLRAVATLTGGAHLSQLSSATLRQILRGKPSDDTPPRPFPWAEIKSRLSVDLRGPERLTEREQILLEATVAFDGRPAADEQRIATPWGTVTLVVRRVQLSVDQQVVGDMARAAQRHRLRLPGLYVGTHRAQATAFVLLRSGDAEHVAIVVSPELALLVEAPPPDKPVTRPRPGFSMPTVGLALAGLALLAVPVVRRMRRRRRALRPGQELTFEKECVTIGSASENDLVVPGEAIGDRHLSIQREPDGHCTIKDEAGLGIEVNNRPVRVGELHDGDLIGFGPYRLQFTVANGSLKLKVLNSSAH